ncbi:hypothetical protein B0H16DRAFT_1697847 [Mycena metata]|uniref:Uncharacterized protein n=1 Tax=Mycena metata TaxID=1033252 RepID=A0AAD7MQ33_9AGAR|nr:hypothetical protein B0H16DRAFT_1697847 [Mycena metata]
MGPSPPSRLLLGLTLFLTLTHATVAVYTPTQVVFTTAPAISGTPAAYTGVTAYNPGTLAPPPLPTPAVLTNPIPINLQNAGTPGLGIKQKGSFLGFSIEMSVTNQVLGKNLTLQQVPFLNLMANIVQRTGSVVAMGEILNGRVLSKNPTGVTGTTQTPPLDFTPDLLYMIRNISDIPWAGWGAGRRDEAASAGLGPAPRLASSWLWLRAHSHFSALPRSNAMWAVREENQRIKRRKRPRAHTRTRPRTKSGRVLVHTAATSRHRLAHADTDSACRRCAYLRMSCACASASSPLTRQLRPFPTLTFAAAPPHAPPPLPVTELRAHMHMTCAQADSSRACAAPSTRNLPPPISTFLSHLSLPFPLFALLPPPFSSPSLVRGVIESKWTEAYRGFGLRDFGGVCSIGFDTRGRRRLTRTKSGLMRAVQLERNTYISSMLGGSPEKFDVEYRGVERGYYGLKQWEARISYDGVFKLEAVVEELRQSWQLLTRRSRIQERRNEKSPELGSIQDLVEVEIDNLNNVLTGWKGAQL